MTIPSPQVTSPIPLHRLSPSSKRVSASTSPVVLDASVLSALLLNDPIKDKAACYLPKAVTSAASVEEVFSSISPKLIPAEAKYAALKQLNLQIIPLSLRYADMIGSLRHQPYGQNLSLEQRATLALAIDYNIPVLTTNPQWQKLNTGVPILVIGHAQEGRA